MLLSMRLLTAIALVVLLGRCTLVTCEDTCDVPFDAGTAGGSGGNAGGSAGGAAGGTAGGGSAGGEAGGMGGGSAGGEAGGMGGGSGGGEAGGMGGGDAGGSAGGSAGGTPSVVFVTSATFHGNFGFQAPGFNGAAAADRLCSNAAMTAGLQGTFKAWASGAGMSPTSRLADASPWVLRGTMTTVFASKGAMNGSPQVPINRDQNGQLVANAPVWTGATTGLIASLNCTNWTNNTTGTGVQGTTASTGQWTSSGSAAMCSTMARLYCFQQ